MANSVGRVPQIDPETGRFPDRYAPESVELDAAAAAQAKLDAQQARTDAQGIADGVPAQATAAVANEVLAQVDPKVAAAAGSAGTAVQAKTDAAQILVETKDARDQTVAVGNTNDTIMAAKAADPTSAFSGVLSAAFVAKNAGWEDALSDAVNSWHSSPREIYNELRDRIYGGIVSEGGTTGLAANDRRRRTSDRVKLGQGAADDHNTPALLAEEDLPILTAYPEHAVKNYVPVKVGSSPHDLASLATATEVQVPFPGLCTYAHLTRRPATLTATLGTRNEDGWYISRSTNWGVTWGTAVKFHNKAYSDFKLVGNIAHYAVYDHPITTPNNSIYYFKIDLVSGDISNAAGVVWGNYYTMTGAIPNSAMTLVNQAFDTDVPSNSNRVMDIAPDGSIGAMKLDKNFPELGGMYGVYRFATTAGWAWEPIVHSGLPVGYYQSGYPGGICFGETSNIIYDCRESVGTWSLERRAKSSTWALTHTIATRTDGTKLGRPKMPWGSDGLGILAAIEYHRYPIDSFSGYYGDKLIFNTNIVNPVVPDTTPPAVPTGLSSTSGQLSAILDWADVPDAAGYRIYQGASLKAAVAASTATISGLAEGVPYSFHVAAFDAAGNESAKASFSSVTPGPRILTADELLPNGTLVLIDPTHSLGSWAAGVPAGGSTVTNLARAKALATVGSGVAGDYDFTVSNTLTATDGAMSRTTKGGLAVIASQATAAQNRNYTMACEKIRAFMAANPTHSYFLSIWATPTRLSLEAVPGTLQRNVGFLSGASGDTISARLATGNKLTVAPSTNRLGVKESSTPAVVGAPINVNGGLSSITAPGSLAEFVMMGTSNIASAVNKAASWILYHIRLEDLTASGRTYAQVAELDQIEFDQAFKAGARFSGDTYTAVSTLP